MVSKSILVVLGLTLILSHSTGIKISSDGGYTDIVIKIKDEVPEDRCPQILQNLKVSSFHYRLGIVKRITIENLMYTFVTLIHFPSWTFFWLVFVFLAKQVRVSACAKGHLLALGPRNPD